MRHLPALAAATLALIAGPAIAQEILLFEGYEFGGRRFGANYSVSNLDGVDFNDRASSVVIRSGSWQLCTDANYRGRCVTHGTGEYRLASMGLSNQVSSLRPVGEGGPGGGGWGGGGSGGSVTLFEDFGFGGRAFGVDGPTENLGRTGFNDRARSMIVRGGAWEVCADDGYRNCRTFRPGEVANLGALAGQVSSLRPVGGGGGWGGGRPPPDWNDRGQVTFYEQPGFGGRSFAMNDEEIDNFAHTGFNDRAASLRIERGTWLFCSDADFRGTCRTFGPGSYPSLPGGLDRQISSARRIGGDYPYRNEPNWPGEYSQQ
ncbi:MAG TPA: beta/gamma crystallin-related protein [Casimicrobiaceae bacterium]|nr:beta/gamma crystallin-related protein [Casimicrobiaceae bacterium]